MTADFDETYSEYHRAVRSVIFRIAGPQALDDLVQEAFLKIYKALPSFRGESKLSTWVFKIATRTALDHLRRSRGWMFWKAPLQPEESPGPQPSPDLRMTFEQCLRQLSPDHRAILVLAYDQHLSLHDISEVLGCPLGTVKSRLSRAKSELLQSLEKEGVDV